MNSLEEDVAASNVSTFEDNKLKNDSDTEFFQGVTDGPVDIPKKPASAYVAISIVCTLISFGGFVFGWDTGTISGFLKQPDFIHRFGNTHKDGTKYLSKIRTGLIVSLFNAGCCIGSLAFSRLGDLYGRKKALAITCCVYVVGIVIEIASISAWYQYMIGRIIAGLGVGGITVYTPMLISEVAPKHLRGALIAVYQLMVTVGVFLGYCASYSTRNYDDSRQWRIQLGLCFAWAIIMIGATSIVHESPRYLMEIGDVEAARRSIAKSNKIDIDDPSVTAELEVIASGIAAEKEGGEAGWADLFTVKTKHLHRSMMGLGIQILNQFSGVNYFLYYGTSLFTSVGIDDAFETSIVFGVVDMFSACFTPYIIEHFGRRKSLLYGSAIQSICLVIFASLGVTRLYPNGMDQKASKGAGNCMIVFTCFFLSSFNSTWAPISHVVVAESFPLKIRAKGIGFCNAGNWFSNFLISLFTPLISGAIHFNYGFVFMSCMCLSYVFVFLFVPETKGLSLEDINTMWLEGVLPWKSTEWIPPSRRDETYDAHNMAHDDVPLYKRIMPKFGTGNFHLKHTSEV